MKQRFLEAGRIINTFGVRGEVKIEPWADSAEFLLGFDTIYISGEPRRVLSARAHKGFVLAALEGVEDVNTAVLLKGKVISIDRGEASLPEGSYFLSDIIGGRVVTEEGAELGILADVLDMPAAPVYVVKGEREILIPAVPEFVRNVDAEAGVVTVRLIEGM